MSATLPRLLDRKQLADELNVNLSTAERIMRKVPKVTVGRRIYVKDADVKDYLRKATSF